MQLTLKSKNYGWRSGAGNPEESFTFKADSARSVLCHWRRRETRKFLEEDWKTIDGTGTIINKVEATR
jgi:hypothetical protein